jgi:citrate synthase
MTAPLPRLTAAQAAARLGVKPQTLYAYVSRGLLGRERGARGSTFDAWEVEAFAAARRPSASAAPSDDAGGIAQGSPLMVLDTDIAAVDDGELLLRGLPASGLAREHAFETVTRWLWRPAFDTPAPDDEAAWFEGDPVAVAAARTALRAMPSTATLLDRIQVAVPVLGGFDTTRHDLGRDAVTAAGARLIGGVVDALDETPRPGAVASRLRRGLSATRPDSASSPETERALNAALVLLADHDLAVSTLAARAAASARATPYAVVSSGLGALDSALHGNASAAASDLIRLVLDGMTAGDAVATVVTRIGGPAPGFGQPMYPGIDDRARVLLPLVQTLGNGDAVADAVARLAREVAGRTGRHPNVDLALAALTTAAGMSADAGAAIFAIARMAGWIAHALNEYEQPPLRLRPRGRYGGPPRREDL